MPPSLLLSQCPTSAESVSGTLAAPEQDNSETGTLRHWVSSGGDLSERINGVGWLPLPRAGSKCSSEDCWVFFLNTLVGFFVGFFKVHV